jgi:Protein of unknown function (DUF3500)
MKSFLITAASVTVGVGLTCLALKSAQEQTTTSQIVSAANAFLSTLDDKQRQAVLYSFDDQEQRQRWSNFPTGVVPRGGISLKQMSEQQRAAAMQLLSLVLSPMGLEKVNEIRMADDDFKVNGSQHHRPGGGPPPGNNGPPNGPGGPPPQFANGGPPPPRPGGPGGPRRGQPFNPGDLFGSNLYYFSFVGKPSTTAPWMLQFGGHHLALNITFAGNRDVMTPTLTGAQPAKFNVNGQTIRPVGRESDKALALLKSLDDKQREQAVLTYRVPDLVLGPGQDGKKIAPEGLKASAMNENQRGMLLDVVSEWAGIINETAASARMAQLKADLDDTWFAWSGPTNFEPGNNITAYYRIQGPHLVIEYAPQNDEPANHVHTIYRDPTNDYGQQLTGK